MSSHRDWVAERRACRKNILCLRLKDGNKKQNRKHENSKDGDKPRRENGYTLSMPSAGRSPETPWNREAQRGTRRLTHQTWKHSVGTLTSI